MKKLVLALALFTVPAIAAAPRLDDSVTDLNAALADLLKPYQTNMSKVALEFQALSSDNTNVLTARAAGAYERVGKVQTLRIRLAGLAYDYANGSPVANLAGDAALDLTQVFTPDQLNGLVDSAEGLVEDIAGNYTKPYGAAAQVKATMLEKTKDAAGNYTAFRASVAFKIDMGQLPNGKKSEDVALLNGVVFLHVTLNKGIVLDGTVMLNPAYKNYGALKVGLEKLLGRDVDMSKKITATLDKLDKMAGDLVDAKVKQ